MKKKLLFGIIATIMCFTLTACGSKENVVSINEKIEGSNLAVTFTEFETPKDDLGEGSYRMNSGDSYEYTKDGYVNRLAHFTIEATGKESVSPEITAVLNYGDGYKFESAKTWYYSPETYTSDLKNKGVWVQNSNKISSFDDPVECVIAFLIPEEAANGTDPLSITFSFEGKDYSVKIR